MQPTTSRSSLRSVVYCPRLYTIPKQHRSGELSMAYQQGSQAAWYNGQSENEVGQSVSMACTSSTERARIPGNTTNHSVKTGACYVVQKVPRSGSSYHECFACRHCDLSPRTDTCTLRDCDITHDSQSSSASLNNLTQRHRACSQVSNVQATFH